MRIGISGCAGTGKTTLAKKLADHFGLSLLRNDVRTYLSGQRITLDDARKNIEKFQTMLLDRRITAEAGCPDGFVSDRSSIDNLAYTLYHGGNSGWICKYYEICMKNALNYDVIVFLPWGCIPAEDDGIRSVNPWYNLSLSCMIFGLLSSPNLSGRVLDMSGCPPDYYFPRVSGYIIRNFLRNG